MKKTPKNIPTYYQSAGTPVYRDTTGLPFLDGGPLVDKTNHGKLLNSVYASALGNYYAQGGMIKRADGSYSPRGLWDNIRANKGSGKEPTKEMLAQERKINREYREGGQFPRPYSLPEDSFKQGGDNLHNSVYASSMAQYPAVYKYGGSFEMPRQQMYMPLDNVERYGGQMYREGGSVFYATNTPQLEGEGKDLTYPDGAYVYDGGGNIRISPFSYHGDTPGLYRFNTQNPTFNINYSQPFGERIAKEQGFESFSGGLTARLPYKPNTKIGIEGNLRAIGRPNRSSTMTVETDLSGGWDPNVGPYANFIASPQFMFGNVSPTKSKVYGTGLHGGEYLGKVGPFLGASFTPRPQEFTEHINTTTGGAGAVKSTPQAGGMPFGVKGNIDFGLGRKGIRAGLSGYLGADLMGMGLERSDAEIGGVDINEGGIKPRFNYGAQANLTIPIKSAKNYIKNIIDEKKSAELEFENSNPRYASAPKFRNGGVIKTSHLFANGGPIYPTNQQLAQFLNPEYQRVTQGPEITVRPNSAQLLLTNANKRAELANKNKNKTYTYVDPVSNQKIEFDSKQDFIDKQNRNLTTGKTTVSKSDKFVQGLGNVLEYTGVPGGLRTLDRLKEDPLKFAEDVGIAARDLHDLPQNLAYQGVNYLWGDGKFNLPINTEALGVALDATSLLPFVPKGTSRAVKQGVKMIGDDVARGYNKVATGNSFLTDLGMPAWKVERPTGVIRSSDYIVKPYTDYETELLTKYGFGMRDLTPEDWAHFSQLTKSGVTDFSKGNYPISRVIGYYAPASTENKVIQGLKRGDVFTTPTEESIRTWSAGVPNIDYREQLKGRTRLIIPSRYTKDLGSHFAGMPYYDKRVDFVWNHPVTKRLNTNAFSEKELMGNIPEGFKVIGTSSEDGLNNLIIKPIKTQGFKKAYDKTKKLNTGGFTNNNGFSNILNYPNNSYIYPSGGYYK